MTYEEQLKDPRWISLRDTILEKDMHMCQKCMSTENLEVHHRSYIPGRMAWEYSSFYLLTLCRKCHKDKHGISDNKGGGWDSLLGKVSEFKNDLKLLIERMNG